MKNLDSSENVADAKIDAIKHLIFGENMMDYDARFDKVNSTITKLKTEMESKMKKLEVKLAEMVTSLRDDHDKDLSQMEVKMAKEFVKINDKKADRMALGKMLQNIGEKLQA